MKTPCVSFFPLGAIVFGLSSQIPLQGALLFYDGFAAGGATPNTSQYQTSPASTNGVNNNSLVRAVNGTANGQAPVTTGFSTAGWRTTDLVASTVYGRASDTGLTYAGMPTVTGSASIFRSGSNSIPQFKNYFRGLATDTGAGASTLYLSSLMQFTASTAGTIALRQSSSDTLSLGFNAAGNVVLNQTTGISGGTSALTYASGATYLLVAKIYSTNLVDVWLNPTDLSNEAASSGQKVISGATITAGGFTLGTALADLRIASNTGESVSNPNFLIDEVRGATTWGEALTAVPEPSVTGLGILAALVFLNRRRR